MRDIPRAWYVVGAVLALVGVLAAIGATAADDEPATVTIEYFVSDTGGGEVSLTYTNGDGNTEQQQIRLDAGGRWNQRYEMESGAFVSISAQRGAGGGAVRCTINADNTRIERAESSGAFVIAACSGSVP